MITTEEIAIKVYQMLQNSDLATMISGCVDYERNDYTKEDVIVIPHTIDYQGREWEISKENQYQTAHRDQSKGYRDTAKPL